MVKEKYLKLVIWLIYIFPVAYITGPFLTNLIVGFTSILFLLYLILEKKLFSNKFLNFFLIFWIYLNINSLFSEDLYISLKVSIPFFRYGFFIYAIYYLIVNSHIDINKLLKFYILITVILFFDILFEFNFGFNTFGFTNNDPERISSFFKDELIVGSFLLKLSLITSSIFFLKKNNINNYYMFIFLSLIWYAVFITGERTPFILLSISFFALLILTRNYRKYFLVTILLGISLIMLQSLSSDILKERYFDKFFAKISFINKFTKEDKVIDVIDEFSSSTVVSDTKKIYFSIHHTAHLLALKKVLKNSNILFGIGPNQFRTYTCKEDFKVFDEPKNPFEQEINFSACSTHPHSMYPQILLEIGIVGLILLSYFVYLIIKDFFIKIILNKNNNQISYLIILSSVIIIYLPMIPSGNFFGSYYGSINSFVIGFYIAISKLVEKNGK